MRDIISGGLNIPIPVKTNSGKNNTKTPKTTK